MLLYIFLLIYSLKITPIHKPYRGYFLPSYILLLKPCSSTMSFIIFTISPSSLPSITIPPSILNTTSIGKAFLYGLSLEVNASKMSRIHNNLDSKLKSSSVNPFGYPVPFKYS